MNQVAQFAFWIVTVVIAAELGHRRGRLRPQEPQHETLSSQLENVRRTVERLTRDGDALADEMRYLHSRISWTQRVWLICRREESRASASRLTEEVAQ